MQQCAEDYCILSQLDFLHKIISYITFITSFGIVVWTPLITLSSTVGPV